jgi:protein-tyrosine phosphatase
MSPKKILFVCLGNICRSPMAEAIFQNKIEKKKLTDLFYCDSAGTANYHIGNRPDSRTLHALNKHGIYTNHVGRQLSKDDFNDFDHILVMDKNNWKDVLRICPTEELKSKVQLLRNFDLENPQAEVADPYYGTIKDFDGCYEILDRCCFNLIAELRK